MSGYLASIGDAIACSAKVKWRWRGGCGGHNAARGDEVGCSLAVTLMWLVRSETMESTIRDLDFGTQQVSFYMDLV